MLTYVYPDNCPGILETRRLTKQTCSGFDESVICVYKSFTWILQVHGAFNSKTGSVDPWQLHASRLGLIAQALLQLFTALFIIADVKRDIWKNRSVAVKSILFFT